MDITIINLLYESIANIVGFLLIYFVIRKIRQNKVNNSLVILFGMESLDSLLRLRTDSLYVMGLRTAQLVSIVFVIVGIAGYIYCKNMVNRR